MKRNDGHQSHQYQQTKQSPLILTKLTGHKTTTTCDISNPGPGLRRAYNYGGVKPLNGIQTQVIIM